MNKKFIFIGFGVLLLAFLLFSNRSHKVSWLPTFDETETKPLDTKIFFEQLSYWFPNKKVTKLYTTFYEYVNELEDSVYYQRHNYISVGEDYTIDKPSFDELLHYISQGNTAFIAAHTFPDFMKDTLGFKVTYNAVSLQEEKNASYLNHINDSLNYVLKYPYGEAFIPDTIGVQQIGYSYNEFCESQSNFVGIPFQEGIFYVHTTPELFTNYQLLEIDNSFYHDQVISFLPDVPVLFEKNFKIDPDLQNGSLSFVISKPALKCSYYLALFAIGLFMLFNAKRRQRVIPIIEPLKNTTTEFVQTLSTLHLEAEDYNGMIQKNIMYFLEFVRKQYHLSTEKLDANFIQKLAQRSGKTEQEIQSLITKIKRMRMHKFSSTEPLKELNNALENFYNRK